MIMSGWILPDMYEVRCDSCSTFNEHVQIVKRYLKNLEQKDYTSYSRVANLLCNLREVNPYLTLDDFAVICLGWIKIINYPMNIVFVTENNILDFLVENYVVFGYTTVLLQKSRYHIQLDIPSKTLI